VATASETASFGPGDDLGKVKEYLEVEESPEITYLSSVWQTKLDQPNEEVSLKPLGMKTSESGDIASE
jgi:hypothetical protein